MLGGRQVFRIQLLSLSSLDDAHLFFNLSFYETLSCSSLPFLPFRRPSAMTSHAWVDELLYSSRWPTTTWPLFSTCSVYRQPDSPRTQVWRFDGWRRGHLQAILIERTGYHHGRTHTHVHKRWSKTRQAASTSQSRPTASPSRPCWQSPRFSAQTPSVPPPYPQRHSARHVAIHRLPTAHPTSVSHAIPKRERESRRDCVCVREFPLPQHEYSARLPRPSSWTPSDLLLEHQTPRIRGRRCSLLPSESIRIPWLDFVSSGLGRIGSGCLGRLGYRRRRSRSRGGVRG